MSGVSSDPNCDKVNLEHEDVMRKKILPAAKIGAFFLLDISREGDVN